MSESIRVLIVEDELATNKLVSFVLQRHGYQICATTDGNEAVEAFERFQPDVVLLDLELPTMSGVEVLRCIRGQSTRPDVTVVVLTSTMYESLAEPIAADSVCAKPIAPSKLLQILNQFAPVGEAL